MEIKYDRVSYKCKDTHKTILSNIEFDIKKQNITAIMGNSGSGKTTLVEMIDGLVIPSDGSVFVGNNVIDKNDIRTKVGIVFQNSVDQFFMDTVEKEISFATKHLNKKVKNVRKHVIDSLIMVGLDETYLNRNPFSLSSGEKKKVAIASVLCANPKIIVLDEPTIGLDNESMDNLISLLKKLKTRYEKTIVLVSKDSDFVHKIADKVVIINNGKIVLSGTKYEVFTSDIDKYGLKQPKIIQFEQLARNKKNIRLLYRDEINDLMKDIYRYANR